VSLLVSKLIDFKFTGDCETECEKKYFSIFLLIHIAIMTSIIIMAIANTNTNTNKL